jgi:hypothetical protein
MCHSVWLSILNSVMNSAYLINSLLLMLANKTICLHLCLFEWQNRNFCALVSGITHKLESFCLQRHLDSYHSSWTNYTQQHTDIRECEWKVDSVISCENCVLIATPAEFPQCCCGEIRHMLTFLINLYCPKGFHMHDHSTRIAEYHRKRLSLTSASSPKLEPRTVFGFST